MRLKRAAIGVAGQEWVSPTRVEQGATGFQRGSMPVQVHPDWWAQLLLEPVRAAESEQALDRL